jgi:phage terminase large subunit-like protein
VNLRTVVAKRYVTPLREGGSLPAIVEADDDGTYVLKFRGAGQGKALIAEPLAGEIAPQGCLRRDRFRRADPELTHRARPEIQS